jgi:chromosome segregation ATPase
MGVLKELQSRGLRDELNKVYDKWITSNTDKDSRKQLDDAIDAAGLKAPKTMQLIGFLQRTGKLQPGLYKELVNLNRKLEEGSTQLTETQSKDSSSEDKSNPSGGQEVMDVKKEEKKEEVKKDNVVNLEGFVLTDKDKEKIKARLQKEEEKIRQRLLKYEQKATERLKARAEKTAQRKGMKLEEMQEIRERKDKLTVLREEIKSRRAEAKKLKDEIKKLRPARQKKEKKEKTEEKVEKKSA